MIENLALMAKEEWDMRTYLRLARLKILSQSNPLAFHGEQVFSATEHSQSVSLRLAGCRNCACCVALPERLQLLLRVIHPRHACCADQLKHCAAT